jgi:hypothetical protein
VRGPCGRRSLRRRNPFVAILLLAVCRLDEMSVHCRCVMAVCGEGVCVVRVQGSGMQRTSDERM